MDAGKKILLDLLTGSLRFVVPVYQRRYSWGETQCRQLWADIVTAGRNPDRTHFTGSIVWMQDGGIGPDFSPARLVSADASSSTASSASPR